MTERDKKLIAMKLANLRESIALYQAEIDSMSRQPQTDWFRYMIANHRTRIHDDEHEIEKLEAKK